MDIKSLIRTIPNYPKEGIMFRDVTTLFKDAAGMKYVMDQLTERYKDTSIDYVAGIESRGFIIGMPLALNLNVGFIPVRKKGKLPAETVSQEYQLEYGTDVLEIHVDALKPGDKVLLIDDLLATGGTALAAKSLVEKLDATVVEAAFLIDLPELNGSKRLTDAGCPNFYLLEFDGH